MTIYAGDEIYGDEITSGPSDDWAACIECGQHEDACECDEA